MELTRQSISSHLKLIPGIEGYLTLIEKIEKNNSTHPDIAIESCKSLMEGLCLKALSLLSAKYNASKALRTSCKNDLKVLTITAFDEVYSNYIESQIHVSLSNILIDVSVANKIKENAKRKVKEQAIETVGKVSALRNERGDISHGRNYPKEQESSIKLAKSISAITDGICSFMIEEIAEKYHLKLKTQNKLIYKDLSEFNTWLDEKHHVLSIKIDFSKLLYENAYEKYEEFYFSEYVDLFETEQEIPIEDHELYTTSKALEHVPPTTVEVQEVGEMEPKKAEDSKSTIPIIEKLVPYLDEALFWTEQRSQSLQYFAQTENLKTEELKDVIDEYIFTKRIPLRDDAILAMQEKPSLKDRAKITDKLIMKILAFVDNLNEL